MFCDKCGKEISDKAVMRPYCNAVFKKEVKTSNKWIIGCLSPFIVLGFLIFIGNISDLQTDTSGYAKNKAKPRLEVLKTYNCKLTSYGGSAACGVVINNTSRNMTYVEVDINLYDMNNNQIGSTIANVNNLAAGSKWEFKAPIIQQGKYKWEVVDVKGF